MCWGAHLTPGFLFWHQCLPPRRNFHKAVFFYFIASLLLLTFLISNILFNLPFNLELMLLLLCSAVPSVAVVAIG